MEKLFLEWLTRCLILTLLNLRPVQMVWLASEESATSSEACEVDGSSDVKDTRELSQTGHLILMFGTLCVTASQEAPQSVEGSRKQVGGSASRE